MTQTVQTNTHLDIQNVFNIHKTTHVMFDKMLKIVLTELNR
jgi:hypothetical protein